MVSYSKHTTLTQQRNMHMLLFMIQYTVKTKELMGPQYDQLLGFLMSPHQS
jgi:hypothetical protein